MEMVCSKIMIIDNTCTFVIVISAGTSDVRMLLSVDSCLALPKTTVEPKDKDDG